MARENTLYEAAGQAMLAAPVRAKQRQVADRVAKTATGLAAAENAALTIGRSGGVRPGGRPFERVTATAGGELGDQFTPRRRILGRAATLSARTGGRRR